VASFAAIGRVLSRRNTQIYYGCSLGSWTGLWVQKVSTDWLAWELTHSALWVGILAFCNLAPSVLISPFAGAVSDRVDRVRLTMVTQLITVAHSLTLATLTLTGIIRIEHMAILEVLNGSSQAFAQPARQSLVPGMVPRSDLPGAVALNSLTYNLARSVGPMIGGLILVVGGVVPCMFVNAAAYAIASASMPLLRLDPAVRRGHAPTASVSREALDGILYVVRHPGMGPLFLFAAIMGVLVRAIPEMFAPFVAGLFGRDAGGLATLATTMGMAALIGGILVAMHGKLKGLCRVALASGALLAVSTAGFVATGSFPFAVVCVAGIGAAMTIHGISVQTLLQTATSGHMIGRVLSFWGMITRAAPAMGALLYGAASEVAGLRIPVLIGSALALVVCAVAFTRVRFWAGSLERAEA
jgi:MFS family permease